MLNPMNEKYTNGEVEVVDEDPSISEGRIEFKVFGPGREGIKKDSIKEVIIEAVNKQLNIDEGKEERD